MPTFIPTVEVVYEAIGLMERLDKVLQNATKKKDKGKGKVRGVTVPWFNNLPHVHGGEE
jgi:hypothetical protein